ncbi:MAG: hypothetical protein EPN22_04480 [Nitrospirae bacterium]|nr:MAG: hypothetical protein EPN22_04480 [Nitrospirota bacterium]
MIEDGIETDSLKKRYISKLSTNIVGMAVNLIAQAVIPRGLGPKAYGDYNFLMNFFTELVNFLDMGTSTCFYTELSRRRGEHELVRFYVRFAGLLCLIVFGFVAVVNISGGCREIWPGQDMYYVYLSAGLAALTWILKVLNSIADAHGLTVSSEFARMGHRILWLVLILAFYSTQGLALGSFFYCSIAALFMLAAAYFLIMKKNVLSLKFTGGVAAALIKKYMHDFYSYSHPFFAYSLIGFAVVVADRWLLQQFGGSVQQGFFGLASQMGAFSFLFAGAMTPLFIREFSISYGSNDIVHMGHLYRRYIPPLFSLVAYFSCFVAAQAEKAIYIFGGPGFREAGQVVTIMAFLPIHQTYGQLSSSVFLATGQTRLYTNIGIVFMLLGLPLTYFLVASHDRMGLNAGAAGLAIKMVLMQFVGINVQIYFNTKLLKLPFYKYFIHQFASVGFLLAIALAAAFLADGPLGFGRMPVAGFLLSGVLYTLMTFCMVCGVPALFGLKRSDIRSVFARMSFK